MRYIFVIFWYSLCILSCIDTRHFVYASLSQTLYPAIIGLLIAIFFGIVCLFKKRTPNICIAQMFAILLVTYMLLHGFVVKDAEIYKQGYTVSTLLSMVVLGEVIKAAIMNVRHVENGIILISLLNIICLIAQLLGLIDSGNSFFQLTGANGNPNTAAITLTISIPFFISRLIQGKHRYAFSALLLFIVLFILMLRCRTAIVGMVCIIVCYALNSSITRRVIKDRIKGKTGIFMLVCITIIVIVLGIFGYNWKKDSADGRLFIWKRSCEMIANSPLGYGYGRYEVEYNLYQSKYFAEHKDEYYSSNLATASGSAYNDVLEHGVQGGVIGSVLFLAFFIASLFLSCQNKNNTYSIALFAVIVMSMTNSICYSISPWIMTISIMAIVVGTSPKNITGNTIRRLCFFVLTSLSFLLLHREGRLMISQKQLKEFKTHARHSIQKINSLYPAIGTSEAYWRSMAAEYEKIEDYESADKCYTEARKYTAAPLLLFKSAMCKECIGDSSSAIGIMRNAVCMLPRNLSLKYHLMMMYGRINDKYHARQIAHGIVVVQEKIQNESVLFIKNEAMEKLKE